MNLMKDIILEVFNFIKNPKDERVENWTLQKNVNFIVCILAFELLINTLIYFPILYFLNKVEPIISDSRIDYGNNSLISMLLISAFFIPIFEELVFRLPLRYNKFFAVFINKSNWNKRFRFFVYFSILFFGFVHSFNFENNSIFFYCVLPIIVSTQIIGGVFITIIRVKFNLTSSIIYHMIWNSLFLTIIPLAISFFEKPYIKETNNYFIKIESIIYNTKHSQRFKIDSSSNKIHNVIINEYSINHILDSLSHYKRNNEDYLINIEFKSEEGINKENFKKILLEYDKEEQN
jgi:membrane protease YdiL (CAAX protease family)